MKEEEKYKEVSLESMERLAEIMNDTPSFKKLEGTEYAITALKPGTLWLICEEVCKIERSEHMSMGDIVKELTTTIPAIIRIITLCILNDKDRIFKNESKREYSDEYNAVYDTIRWQTTDFSGLLEILVEVLRLIDVDFFFESTDVIQILKNQILKRKKTMREVKQLSREQNGDK